MVSNYEEATNAKDTKNGIRINGCSVDIGYTDNQLVVRADLELLYMVLDKITIEADRTSIEVCGGETNVCVTGHFHLVTKTEDDSSDGSSITDTTIPATWSDDADSAGPSTCTVISFDENKIGGTDEITTDPSDQPERTETTTATYTYKGTNLTSDNDTEKTSNTVTVTQAANILGEWYKETSLDRNFSITPSCPGIVSENGGTATATSTVTYEYCEERKDSCDHIVGRKWTTTTITGPSGSASFDEQECDADERSQTISLVYTHVNGASVSTTCTTTQEASSVPCYCGQVCSDVGCSGKIHWLCAEKKGDTEYEYDCSTAKITNLVDGKLLASGGTATVTVEGNSKKGIWTKSAYCGYETLPTEIVTSLPSLSNVESSQDKVYLIVDQEGKTGGTLYYTDSNGDTQSTYSYTYTSYTWYHYTVWPEDVTIGKKTIKEEKWGWKSGTVYVKHANSASSYGWKSYTYRCNSAVSCDAKREEFVNDGNSESTWDSRYETWYDKWLTYQASEKFFCDGVEVSSEEEMLNCEGEQNRYLDESLNPGEFSVIGEYWGTSTVYGENENYYGVNSMYLCCVRNISTETDYLVDHLSDKTPITSNTSFTYAANTSSSDRTGTATVTLNGGYTCQVPYTVAAGTSGTPCMTISYTLTNGAAGTVYFKTTNGTQQGSHEVDATGSQALCNIAENTTLVVSHSNTAVTVGGDTSFVYKSGTTANISLTIVGGGETITNNCASVSVQGRNWTVTLPKAAASDLTYKFYAVNGFNEEGNINSGLDWEQTVSVSKGSTNGTARSTQYQFATDDSYFISVSPSEDNTYNYSDCSIYVTSDWNGNEGEEGGDDTPIVTSTTYSYSGSAESMGECDTTTTATVKYTPTYHYSDGTTEKGSITTFSGSKTLTYKYQGDSTYKSTLPKNTGSTSLDVNVRITFTHNGSSQEVIATTVQDRGPCNENTSTTSCTCTVTSISVSPTSHEYTSANEEKSFTVTINDNSSTCENCNGGFKVYDSNGLQVDNGTTSFTMTNTGGTFTIKANDDTSKTCTLTLTKYTPSTPSDITGSTTEYSIQVLDATMAKCDTTVSPTVQGRSRTGKTHTDGTATEWGSWGSWSNLSSTDYTLSYEPSLGKNETSSAKTYTVKATGKGTYDGKTDTGTITQSAGPCTPTVTYTCNGVSVGNFSITSGGTTVTGYVTSYATSSDSTIVGVPVTVSSKPTWASVTIDSSFDSSKKGYKISVSASTNLDDARSGTLSISQSSNSYGCSGSDSSTISQDSGLVAMDIVITNDDDRQATLDFYYSDGTLVTSCEARTSAWTFYGKKGYSVEIHCSEPALNLSTTTFTVVEGGTVNIEITLF